MTKVAIFSADEARFNKLSEEVSRGGFAPAREGGDICLIDADGDIDKATAAARSAKEQGLPVVLVLTAGMQLGPESAEIIDDFIVEPFSGAELWLRLKRLAAVSAETKPIKIDGLVIHPDTYEALIDGVPLSLTYKEYELLKFLAGHPERVWDRQTLLNQIWEYDYFGGTRTVDVHIRRLRAKLGRYGDLIQTVRQVGYKFSPIP